MANLKSTGVHRLELMALVALWFGIATLACAQEAGSGSGMEATAAATAERIDKVTVEATDAVRDSVTTTTSTAGASALDRIESARAAIATDDLVSAKTDLTEAHTQLQKLRSLNPAAPVQDSIRQAQEKLQSEGPQAAIAQLEPVSEKLVVQDDYDDAVMDLKVQSSHARYVAGGKAHQHIEQALTALRENDVEQAQVELDSARETAVYTQIDLPVDAAYYEVGLALQALADGHPQIADQQLAAAESQARTVVEVAQKGVRQVDVAAPPAE
jgi:cellobiose-specific phosphotransferase system component IIA